MNIFYLNPFQQGQGGMQIPPFLCYSETSEVFKIYLATFKQKYFEKCFISEPLRGKRSAAGIFKKLEALNISVIINHWKVFSSLVWSFQRSHMYVRL